MKRFKQISLLMLSIAMSTAAWAGTYTLSERVAYCATLDYIMQHNTLSSGALLGARVGAAQAGCAEINPERIAAYQQVNFK